jgi:hypothetical protein
MVDNFLAQRKHEGNLQFGGTALIYLVLFILQVSLPVHRYETIVFPVHLCADSYEPF